MPTTVRSVSEAADRMYERARRAADADGRLGLPSYVEWDVFPFEGDLKVRPLDPPVLPEPPRVGEDGDDCPSCERGDSGVLWSDERWVLVPLDEPNGLPALVMLETREHLDLPDLSDELAAEFGRLTVSLVKVMKGLDGVANVHVSRWGDGGAHLHVFFYARPAGFSQLRGTVLALWDDILPATPRDEWDTNLRLIARGLSAAHGGRAHV